ncbi:tail fiber domain-containing protein [Portibacter marinus]|uniref:tail fiber domain-containing protein n=1 Tax=Portibacter marinus TaxID=2898660 RepID=UPI001F39A596|nr:tail fiber domain-containing protein [Portibacter marinus]
MKTLSIFLTLLLFSFMANAQIEMNSSGEAGVGTSPLSGFSLNVYGDTRITPSNSNGTAEGLDIEITPLGSPPTWQTMLVFDAENNSGQIGNSGNRISNLYSDKVNANTYITNSDQNIKENVLPISNAITKILQVNTVTYDLKSSYFGNSSEELLNQLVNDSKAIPGVIAQEVQEIFP